MPTTNVIPTPQTLPEGFCPTTWQDTLDAFAAGMRVTLPTDYGQIIISQTTPGSGEHGKIWFKTDAGGHILGIYSWDTVSGAWEIADPYPYYFVDTGGDSAIVINTGEGISSAASIVGRAFFVRIAASSTSTTVTFKVDSLAAYNVKKYGGINLSSGDLSEDMVAILVYTGTEFELLNPAIIVATNPISKEYHSSLIAIGTAGTEATAVNHNLGTWPKISHVVLRCISTQTFTVGATTEEIQAGTEIDIRNFVGFQRGTWCSGSEDGTFPPIRLDCTETTARIIWNQNGGCDSIFIKTHLTPASGVYGHQPIDPTKWNLRFDLYA